MVNAEAETGTPEQWRSNVRDALKNIDRWLLWDASADTPRRPHWRGDFSVSYPDEDCWHTFDEAVEAAQEKDSWGIGFVTGDDVAVIDVDGAAEIGDDGRPHPKDWVPSIRPIKRAGDGDVYVEWSPSETGLHIPVKDLEADWWTDVDVEEADHEGVDVLQGQFCTVTGDVERGFGGSVVEFNPKIDLWLRDVKQNIEAVNDGDELDGDGDGDGWSPDEEWLTEGDIRKALTYLNADCGYQKWRDIGFAVAEFFYEYEDERNDEYDVDEAREKALEVFREWSRTADEKWDSQAEEMCERIIADSWDRIAVEDDPITVGTLIAYARNAGWEMPDPPESVQAAAAKETVAEFIAEYDPMEERPEKPDPDGDLSAAEQAALDEWPSGDEKTAVADALVDMRGDDFDMVKRLVADRLANQEVDGIETHRRVSRSVREESSSLVNHDGELVKAEVSGRWASYSTVFNFEFDVQSLLSVEGEGRMANVEVRPSEPSESPFEMQIEPKMFNDIRRFRDEVLAQRFSTTVEVDWSHDTLLDTVRKFVSRQDVPQLIGQKQMGLAPNGDEFVTPNGVIDSDGWSDDPETVFVARDVGAERKFEANPDQNGDVDTEDVAEMMELFTRTRDPERFVPVLGWFYAAPFRRLIFDRNQSFNLLSVVGESGVGKTGTLGVASRMFGMSSEPGSCNDTKFSMITSLASSRGPPIWLDEYRASNLAEWQKDTLHDMLKKAATGGVEQRGNADQTTSEYFLRAPVVVSGETRVRGSAEQRRAIDVTFRDAPTHPDADEYERFKHLVGDAVTDDEGNVTFPDARYELEDHAVAYYSYVAAMSAAEFEERWFSARENVSKRLAQWDTEMDDLEIQGLQTVVFGFRVMRAFAESVGADVSKLPGEDELEAALRRVADVDGRGRETHTDEFLGLCARAASADYLEQGQHYTFVHTGEEIRLDVNQSFDAVSKYVRDHGLSADLLGSARDYKERFREEDDKDDSYVACTSQNTPPLGRCTGITVEVAEADIEGFDRRLFADVDDEGVAIGDKNDSDSDGGDGDSGPTPLKAIDASDDYVTVAGKVVEWGATPDAVASADGPVESGSVVDATARRDVVVFAGSEPAGITRMEEGETVRIENAAINEFEGSPQLILDTGTSITIKQNENTEAISEEEQRMEMDDENREGTQAERRDWILSELRDEMAAETLIERGCERFDVNKSKLENDVHQMEIAGKIYRPHSETIKRVS